MIGYAKNPRADVGIYAPEVEIWNLCLAAAAANSRPMFRANIADARACIRDVSDNRQRNVLAAVVEDVNRSAHVASWRKR